MKIDRRVTAGEQGAVHTRRYLPERDGLGKADGWAAFPA